jgi:Phosphotransferase enzyme family
VTADGERIGARALELIRQEGLCELTDGVESAELLAGGRNSRLYVLRMRSTKRWVVKEFAPGDRARAVAELQGLQLAGPIGLAPSPAVGCIDAGAETSSLVVCAMAQGAPPTPGALSGENLVSAVVALRGAGECLSVQHRSHANPETPDALVTRLAAILGELRERAVLERNGLAVPPIETGLGRAREACGAVAAEGCGDAISFCHGDPNIRNVLLGPGAKLILIDWEYSGMGDSAYEAADLLHHPNNGPFEPECRRAISAVFRAHGSSWWARFHLYDYLLPLAWSMKCALRLELGASDALYAERSQAYLAEFLSQGAFKAG